MAAGCGSTGISPRPMLMGAARNALWAFNVRVSDLPVCHRPQGAAPASRPGVDRSLPEGGRGAPAVWLGTGQNVSVCLMLRRRPPAGLSLSRSNTGRRLERGKHTAPVPGSAQVKIQDGDDQFRFQPPAQILIYIGAGKAVRAIACPCR